MVKMIAMAMMGIGVVLVVWPLFRKGKPCADASMPGGEKCEVVKSSPSDKTEK